MRARLPVIGVDPAYAKPNAVAIWAADGSWHFHEVATVQEWQRLVRKWVGKVERVAIEGGFVGPNKSVSLKLAQARGELATVVTLNGLEVVEVHPQTWAAATLSVRGVTPVRHDERIAAAKLRSRGVVGRELPEDLAVAMCIAEWAAWLPGSCDSLPSGGAACTASDTRRSASRSR